MLDSKICKCCNQKKSVYEFYSHYPSNKNVVYFTEDCRECIQAINSNNIEDFGKYFKQLNIPIVGYEWNKCIEHIQSRHPNCEKENPFGLYQSKMQLHDWMQYSFKDTNFLNSCEFSKEYIE